MSSIHLLPTYPRKAGLIQIKEAFKQMLSTWSDLPVSTGPQYQAVYWSHLEVSEGQIFQAGISVLTDNKELWPWEDASEAELFQFTTTASRLIRAGVLFLAESSRLQKQADAASETQWYVKKDELHKLVKRAVELSDLVDHISDLVDHISDMVDATQLSVFMDKELQIPSETC